MVSLRSPLGNFLQIDNQKLILGAFNDCYSELSAYTVLNYSYLG